MNRHLAHWPPHMRKGLLACGLILAAVSGSGAVLAQTGEEPPAPTPAPTRPGGLNLLKLGTVKVGCPLQTNTASQRNIGFLESDAAYAIAQIPLSLPDGASIRIEGEFAQVRYFSLQSYEGARAGNFIDTLPDSRIASFAGGALNGNIASLPSAGFGERYTVEVRYAEPPADPSDRAANTLYVGAPSTRTGPLRVAKQVVYRIYQPNPGTDPMGDTSLPRFIYTGPQGEIDFEDSPDRRQCGRIERLSNVSGIITPGIVLKRDVRFVPVTNEELNFYPNGDASYLRAATSLAFGKVIVVRSKKMPVPEPAPAPPGDEKVRYWSLCHYELGSSAVVGCIADNDAVTQDDGFDVFVIARENQRPAKATASRGYNFLEWGRKRSELVLLRQVLSRPGFRGNYARVVPQPGRPFQSPEVPLAGTLGAFAPQITYCDASTFNAMADSGGNAVIVACRRAQER